VSKNAIAYEKTVELVKLQMDLLGYVRMLQSQARWIERLVRTLNRRPFAALLWIYEKVFRTDVYRGNLARIVMEPEAKARFRTLEAELLAALGSRKELVEAIQRETKERSNLRGGSDSTVTPFTKHFADAGLPEGRPTGDGAISRAREA
jgi:hypothetical protein